MALYKHLIAWKECHQLVLDVYKASLAEVEYALDVAAARAEERLIP